MLLESDTIMIAPVNAVAAEELGKLKKSLPGGTRTSIIGKSKLIDYVDGTPFSLIIDKIAGSNFCIFAYKDDADLVVDSFKYWVK